MNTLYFPVTENCNFKCSHCYLSAGPGKEDTTISQGDFEKVINNLPVADTRIILSGGEVSTIKKKLNGFLSFLGGKRVRWKSEEGSPMMRVDIQTNGSWATDEEVARDFFEDLSKKGVSRISVKSDTKYHRNFQPNRDVLLDLSDSVYLDDSSNTVLDISYMTRDMNGRNIFPIGRAKNLNVPLSELTYDYDAMCHRAISSKSDDYDLVVNAKGDLYNCCWQMFGLDGNLIKEPLEKIIDKSLRNKDFNLVNRYGISALAIDKGVDRDIVRSVVAHQGECALCYRVFGEDGDLVMRKPEL